MAIIIQPSLTRRGMPRTASPALKGRAKVIRRYAAEKPPAKAGTLNACYSRDCFTPPTRRRREPAPRIALYMRWRRRRLASIEGKSRVELLSVCKLAHIGA
jgi:hypothetical protein